MGFSRVHAKRDRDEVYGTSKVRIHSEAMARHGHGMACLGEQICKHDFTCAIGAEVAQAPSFSTRVTNGKKHVHAGWALLGVPIYGSSSILAPTTQWLT